MHDGVPEPGPPLKAGQLLRWSLRPPGRNRRRPWRAGPRQPRRPGSPGGNGEPAPSPGPGDGTAEKPIIPGRISVRRPDDLLLFDASFTGYFLRKDPTRLERLPPTPSSSSSSRRKVSARRRSSRPTQQNFDEASTRASRPRYRAIRTIRRRTSRKTRPTPRRTRCPSPASGWRGRVASRSRCPPS